MTILAYLDTNALVKLYLPEEGGERVVALLDAVDGVVTSTLTYPESRATFARALERGLITAEQYQEALQNFEEDWAMALTVQMTEAVYRRAGDLMMPHPKLRTLDAIQLSSALEAQKTYEIRFLTFDQTLKAVALALLGKGAVADY